MRDSQRTLGSGERCDDTCHSVGLVTVSIAASDAAEASANVCTPASRSATRSVPTWTDSGASESPSASGVHGIPSEPCTTDSDQLICCQTWLPQLCLVLQTNRTCSVHKLTRSAAECDSGSACSTLAAPPCHVAQRRPLPARQCIRRSIPCSLPSTMVREFAPGSGQERKPVAGRARERGPTRAPPAGRERRGAPCNTAPDALCWGCVAGARRMRGAAHTAAPADSLRPCGMPACIWLPLCAGP